MPLCTPITEPIISGMMSISRRWVLTTSGLSYGPQSFFALRSFFRRAVPFFLMPRESRRRARACTRSICARAGTSVSTGAATEIALRHRRREATHQLVGGEVEQVVELDAAVGKLAEGALLLELKRRDLLRVSLQGERAVEER